MSSYRGTADGPDKAKAIVAVAAIHAAIALVILSGLKVRQDRHKVDQLTTISIREPPPPPPVERMEPAPKPQIMKHPEGAAGSKAKATPVVAPQPKLLTPSPIPAAKVAGTGIATRSGAALAGNGTGSGRTGTGQGGGGAADYSRFTPARLIENIPNSEYRHLAATGIPSGLVGVIILVGPTGTPSNCRIARSSGDPSIDSLVCELTARYVRFEPARDPYGRPVSQDITYFPNWRRR